MNKVFFLSCFALDKNIGREYNERIAELPYDAWVCLMDQDTLPLSPCFGARVNELINKRGNYSLIGCITNRLRDRKQLAGGLFSECGDITTHQLISERLWTNHLTSIKPAQSIAGMFMLFPKSLFTQVKFRENTLRFDICFCMDAAAKGYKIGISEGLYLFHLYRWGQKDPYNYTSHLK